METRDLLILILIVLLVLSVLGIAFLQPLVNLVGNLLSAIFNLFMYILRSLGFITGEVLVTGADMTEYVGKGAIGIVMGGVRGVGQLLVRGGGGSVGTGSAASNTDMALSKIGGGGYCLVGDFNGQRGCVRVDDASRCASGQVFASQTACLSA